MTATTTTHRRVRIIRDEDADNPRFQYEQVGTMACWHRRGMYGEEQPDLSPSEWEREKAALEVGAPDPDLIPAEHVDRIWDKHFVRLPLYMYDHSGVTISTTPFSCPWDSGQLGWIYVRMAVAHQVAGGKHLPSGVTDPDAFVRQWAEERLRAEVEEYDQFLRGDVWGFILEEGEECDHGEIHWEHKDSCWGFWGSDTQKNGMVEHMPDEEWVKLLHEAEEDTWSI